MKAIPVVYLFWLCATAAAQHAVDIRPGKIGHFEGQVYLDDAALRADAPRLPALAEGERLRTVAGRVEVQLGLWATLWMGADSCLYLEDSGPERVRLGLCGGSAVVEIIEGGPQVALAIHLGGAAVELREAGVYRVYAEGPAMRVYRGKARALLEEQAKTVKKGRSVDLVAGLRTARFDPKRGDELQRWAAGRSVLLYGRIRRERLADRMRRQAEIAWDQAKMEREALERAISVSNERQLQEKLQVDAVPPR